MTEQDKVTVDDIIGIVKTEEQTNSVEEVRKLRGRGNETAKRFKYNVNKNCIECDGKFVAYVNSVDGFRIANKLTTLAEEKEQLKSENEWLKSIHFANDVLKENKELKQTIQRLKQNIDELLSVDIEEELLKENEQLKTTIQQLRTDNTKQKKLLNTTMKENEHIKQTIKDMINTERTELGKMTLRHLWRQIQ